MEFLRILALEDQLVNNNNNLHQHSKHQTKLKIWEFLDKLDQLDRQDNNNNLNNNNQVDLVKVQELKEQEKIHYNFWPNTQCSNK